MPPRHTPTDFNSLLLHFFFRSKGAAALSFSRSFFAFLQIGGFCILFCGMILMRWSFVLAGRISGFSPRVRRGKIRAISFFAGIWKFPAEMASDLPMSPHLEQIHGEIRDLFRALAYVLSPNLFRYRIRVCIGHETVEFCLFRYEIGIEYSPLSLPSR